MACSFVSSALLSISAGVREEEDVVNWQKQHPVSCLPSVLKLKSAAKFWRWINPIVSVKLDYLIHGTHIHCLYCSICHEYVTCTYKIRINHIVDFFSCNVFQRLSVQTENLVFRDQVGIMMVSQGCAHISLCVTGTISVENCSQEKGERCFSNISMSVKLIF